MMTKVISLGLGVQSTALYYMASMKEMPTANVAIFSDTGRESTATYSYLEYLKNWQKQNNGIKIAVVKDKNLYQDLIYKSNSTRFASIPAFTSSATGKVGMLRRQCTGDYKIRQVDDYIRDHVYKLPKRARRPQTDVCIGITLDEAERMSIPRERWKVNVYPFLGLKVDSWGNVERIPWAVPRDRKNIMEWYKQKNLPIPPKSACVFCPYQSDHTWAMRKLHAPEDFAAAVRVDEAIRNSTQQGIKNPVYLHRSCVPLSEVEFNITETVEWGECSGTCHT
ncbi:hypothetical protein FXV77_05235 [Sphingobacterium phlebotomi]|uniref:Phosphoadenosine phosphosulfate reductase family protein n=1 Tax=Sphingobacterium phlebotomi TaxID=2605433 RepID=A0A5D4HEZ8_9SPHI|nr:hypothetical protein [Sphingobacterium phlebotomi]TYR37410.1 hypothetical protein FXV77_05235 [Sphingobacterium phlebotomi]